MTDDGRWGRAERQGPCVGGRGRGPIRKFWRGWPGARNALWKKRFAAAASRRAESRKSIVAPVESTARYKYTHLALHPNVGLIHPPGAAGGLQLPAASFVQFG